MSPALALQTMIRTRLVADASVRALVSADAIADQSGRPVDLPSIVIGEDQEIPLGTACRHATRVVSTIHVWAEGDDMLEAKAITDAMRRALRVAPWEAEGHIVMDLRYDGARFLRDPEGDVAHAVVSLEAYMLERL